jgi:hypothetical protein
VSIQADAVMAKTGKAWGLFTEIEPEATLSPHCNKAIRWTQNRARFDSSIPYQIKKQL